MNFTLLPSSSVLTHSSSGIFVPLQSRSVFSSILHRVPKTVSPCCLHRRSNAQITLHPAEGEAEATAACSLTAYPERFAQRLELFPVRVQTSPCAASPFLS